MNYHQLTLLPGFYPEETIHDDLKQVFEHLVNQENSNLVYTYMMFDVKNNKYYIGISIEPYNRYQNYLSGRNSNSEFLQEVGSREEDFKFEIVDSFVDDNYSPSSKKCRATFIESFLINYYDCINNGYNKVLRLHHDYNDTKFWKEVLTDKLFLLYASSNHNLLNERSIEHYTKIDYSISRNNKPRNVNYKRWAISYLKELSDKGIRIYRYGNELGNIDRSNLFRLIKRNNYGSIGSARIHQFIRKLENHLQLPKRECPYFND